MGSTLATRVSVFSVRRASGRDGGSGRAASTFGGSALDDAPVTQRIPEEGVAVDAPDAEATTGRVAAMSIIGRPTGARGVTAAVVAGTSSSALAMRTGRAGASATAVPSPTVGAMRVPA